MPNYGYNKGANLERELVNQARKQGYWAIRSAGSHSPIDVVRITDLGTTLELIQVKSKRTAFKMPEFNPVLKVKRLVAFKAGGKWRFQEAR